MIETENLLQIPCDPEILKSAIQEYEILAQKLNITVPHNWTEFGVSGYTDKLFCI